MDGPYRDHPVAPPAVAPSRDGAVRVEVGLHQLRLELGERRRLVVSGGAARWIRRQRRRDRIRELPLGRARLWVARAHPTRDLALWVEIEPGVVERLGGARPVPLLEPEALAAWRALDRVEAAARGGLEPWSGGALEATELGKGGHRVLVLRFPDRLVVLARPLFRERCRRVLEVCFDGTLVVPGRRGDRRARVHARAGISLTADRIHFCDRDEREVAVLWLPWIAPEDRRELARRFADLIDPLPPEPETSGRREPLAPFASGLGRTSPLAALLPAPLPYSTAARLRR